MLKGLLPISFKGVQYNIPVCVWIPQQYPNAPPIPYVQPTPEMDVVQGHQHVGQDGMCYFPYCNQWTMHSNTSGLLDVMVQAFSAHPPVTAKAPPVGPGTGAGTAVNPPGYQQQQQQQWQQPQQPQPQPQPQPQQQRPQMSEPERFVTETIVQGMNDRRQELNTEMSDLLDDQQRLEAGRLQLIGACGRGSR